MYNYQFSSVQSLSCVRFFVTWWIAACQASLSITNSRSLPKLMSIVLVMPSSSLILWCPLLLPSIFSSIRDFSNESAVCIRWPNYWSFSISPSNEGRKKSIQDWFPWRLTGLNSFLSKGLLGVFPSTTVRRHQFFGALPSLWSSSHKQMWPLGRP